ncbi:type III pantothenate kinase [Porticoccaceae bacterium LTM1]|nr:type III pantothenate kinase [Porticoccaceae bacterium LTM1]
MAILDIDIGNTRIKWRCAKRYGALAHKDSLQLINQHLAGPPERVRVANVAGEEIAEKISAWVFASWAIEAEFARVESIAAGVSCGYEDPTQLGVDRWLAILAAYQKWPGNLVVVSAGSALTADLLTASGQHLGGYIVPGLELQRSALFEGTDQVKVPSEWDQSDLGAASNTLQAVNRGCIHSLLGVIEAASNQLAEPLVVLGGGDAGVLEPHIKDRSVIVAPGLVLEGLDILLP